MKKGLCVRCFLVPFQKCTIFCDIIQGGCKMVILRGEICVLTDVSRDVSTGTFECSIQQVSSKADCKNVIRKK